MHNIDFRPENARDQHNATHECYSDARGVVPGLCSGNYHRRVREELRFFGEWAAWHSRNSEIDTDVLGKNLAADLRRKTPIKKDREAFPF
ncbi:MAG: hypothetical protein DMF69_08940 [Acidobacteria bacterium]|nr:MAG: hypothetical protein DMF69_08940 [Acidobacteriota bacterium]